ncbi:MAG TPA: anaerobic glycerol-3-phosphate dehydrogenase subunit C [Candidatus Limnocylindrales bacterium]|jgi:glycerol-3-phosphate dehydrogenase subunit C
MTIADLVEQASQESVGLSADECLKCNICNTVCPVARVSDHFPGPKYVGPQAQRFRSGAPLPITSALGALRSPDLTVDWCSGCGWCTTVCPAGVKIAEINNRARARSRTGHRPRFRDWLLGQTDLLGQLGAPIAPLANWTLGNTLLRTIGEKTIGIHRNAPVPIYAGGTFRSTWRKRGGRVGAPREGAPPPPDRAVVYFHGCAVNYYEPHVADAAIDVLTRNGYEVIAPEQVCCGLPLISNGLYDDARGHARRNNAELAKWARQGYRIVGTSTSCTHTLKAEYREMLDVDDEDARAVAEATWDICEFLLDLHEHGRLDTGFGRLDEELPYHAPCQLRSHGIGLPALELFALVPGLRAIDLDYDCCGVAGTYGLKREKYDIAMAVGAELFERIEASQATESACDSETCRWQITAATGKPTRHPVEILAAAYAAADPAGIRGTRPGADAAEAVVRGPRPD